MLPLEGGNEQSGHDSIIIYYITCLKLKVIDVLIWRGLAVVWVQYRWLELWWIENKISFQRVKMN